MKKLIFITIALAAVAISCTKSNLLAVPEDQKTPIAFETYNGRTPVTKATQVTQSTFEASTEDAAAFRAIALLADGTGYMDEAVWYVPAVTDDPETEETETAVAAYWDYEGVTYWPSDGSSLTFMAYGLNVPEDNILLSSDLKTLTYTVPEDASSQSDLVVAVPVTKAASASGVVDLEFKHVLSRIGFQLKLDGEGTTVKINNITLHGVFANQGTVALNTAASITNVEGETTSSYSLFADDEEPFEAAETEDAQPIYTGDDVNDRFMMIIPGRSGYMTTGGEKDEKDIDNDEDKDEAIIPYIEVNYDLGSESGIIAKRPLLQDISTTESPDTWQIWNFEAGMAYEFIFEISISKIEFKGEIEPWDENIDDNDDENDNDDIIVRP